MKKLLFIQVHDPITYGHIDVIQKALKIFDNIVVIYLIVNKKINFFY